MPTVVVEGLGKNDGDVAAVDGLDLTIEADEVIALLGPNGAGQTTTVEILEGYRKPDAGTVSVLGMDPQTGWTWRSASSVTRRCCSSASRRRASTRQRASRRGTSSTGSATSARPSCSRRTTSTKPSIWRTGLWSSTTAGSSRRARPSSSRRRPASRR